MLFGKLIILASNVGDIVTWQYGNAMAPSSKPKY